MTESDSEPLNNVVLPQQIMATEQAPSTTTTSCVSTGMAMDSLPANTDTLNNYKSENISQEIATGVESIGGSDTISVSTQVNIMPGHQTETNEFTNHPISQSPTIGDKDTVQDSESVNLSSNAIAMSSEGTIVSNAQGELLEIVPVSSLPGISPIPALNPSLPPWAARLRDCELIGDSYRGYVTNEVELDLILTLHKQHTNSCWGTRQSPSSAKPSIRLMWKSQYVPYDGIPFLNTGRRATVMECQYGPRRKGNVCKKATDFDSQGNALKKAHKPTCPARIYIKKVKKFPEYRIDLDLNLEGKNVRQAQERALTHLRLAGVETGGEERFYVQLPLPIAHEYHDVEDITIVQSPDNRGQRLNQQVADKIHEFVARGVTGVYAIKHCLKEYVEKELYIGQDPPPRHNKAFFPTIIDLQNHIHEAQAALAAGQLLPLPPLSNPSLISNQGKERLRKRKQPVKHSQTCQTINRLQTAEAVASIQELDDENSTENKDEDKQGNDQHLQEQLVQFSESDPQPMVITQTDPTKNGQVVIVVTSNNVFSPGQEASPPTSFAQISLPSSHMTNIPSSSFGTLPTGSQAMLITQQGENGQFLAQTQQNNILTVMNPTLQGIAPNQRVVLRMVPAASGIQPVGTVDSQTDHSVQGQLLANQAAVAGVAAVLNAVATVEGASGQQDKVNDCEPPAKRQAVGIDLSSLVKEAGFDSHHVQVPGVEMTTVESTTPLLTSTQTSTANPQDYTNNTTEATLVEYEYQNNSKPTSQEEALSGQQSVMDSYGVLDSAQSTHQDTVDSSEIQSISMDAELIENFPKFTSTSEPGVVHVSGGSSNGSAITTGMVLVTDDISSFSSHTDSNVGSNGELNEKQLHESQ